MTTNPTKARCPIHGEVESTHLCSGNKLGTLPPAVEPPERHDIAALSELGKHWSTWFGAVGDHATVDVVNATAKLVIAEREIAVRDAVQPEQSGERRHAAERAANKVIDELRRRGCVLVPSGWDAHAWLSTSLTNIIASELSAPTTDEVERALAELREMFPGEHVSIELRDYSGIAGCEGNGYVTITSGACQGAGATLAEAMQAVREWAGKESNGNHE